MLLVCDVGNTETTIGLAEGDALRASWRVMTDVPRTADEFHLLLRGLLDAAGVAREEVTGAAVGSVVPRVTDPLALACAQLTGDATLKIDASSGLPITLDVLEPLTVGADRIINTLAASRRHQRDCIVVDLGTATTYDCITADGVFLGGVIAPGIQTMAETLTRRTAKLPATELRAPASVIGRRTEDCIRSGIVFGAAESVDGLVRRIKAEWPRPGVEPLVIATGGLATVLKPHCREIDLVEPDLTLLGLALAWRLLRGT
ncbi:MAG: type III pantothenate kinase [Gemmatimonadaceae bacterium]|nr:type III pantothenate kinase [Gemmatimonadaceae bacterium]